MADAGSEAEAYAGFRASALARRLHLPMVRLYDSVSSTMNVAHALAGDGAPAGTLVVAELQLEGRGRAGRRWTSEHGAGIWFTILERPTDAIALQVLSLRTGLRLAGVLDRYLPHRVCVKWPNDLYAGSGKLAGILTEVRWKEAAPDWVAIGIGINIGPPSGISHASSLGIPPEARADVLDEVVPAIREAAAARGPLTPAELAAYAARDFTSGRLASSPGRGRIAGIDAEGHLVIVGARGEERFASGSLVLEDTVA